MTELKDVMNVNIAEFESLVTPNEVKKEIPASNEALNQCFESRKQVQDILDGKDDRLFCVVGPCSIHDVKAAEEYAQKLSELSKKVEDRILMIMRVYFEKPRTTVGWKGLINDPFLDDSFHIEKGIKTARKLLIDLNQMGLPTATEALDPIIPQYMAELITWVAIGARTAESQTHREMSSGLSMPVGFKNGTAGDIQTAINAMASCERPHHFLGIDQDGKIGKFSTKGNPYGHVVLRGGDGGPNYDEKSVAQCIELLEKSGLRQKIVVDCSHANADKKYQNQPKVLNDIVRQIQAGNQSLCGVMIESHLEDGNQKLTKDINELKYGISITDQCVGWDLTEEMILSAYDNLKK